MSRQADSIKRIRGLRRTFGECRECGERCAGYRCKKCNEARRAYMRELMRQRRSG